jgi:hypothetical protein
VCLCVCLFVCLFVCVFVCGTVEAETAVLCIPKQFRLLSGRRVTA